MDSHQFDNLTRAIAGATSRRRLIARGLAAFGAIFAGGSLSASRSVLADPICDESCDEVNVCDATSGCGTCCDGKCVNLTRDLFNCGACGNTCAEGEGCFGGSCETLCDVGLTRCTDGCVDLLNDALNCGACHNICADGQDCANGACGGVCPDGLTLCDASCVDIGIDSGNCGSCGNNCPSGQVCSDGSCTTSCASNESNCDGSCTDLMTDSFNCGACGYACGIDQSCEGGFCTGGCAEGELLCDTACIDPQTDDANCGDCGNSCPVGQHCEEGACVEGECASGEELCGDVCADLQSDGDHCGDCDTACAADELCKKGKCKKKDAPDEREIISRIPAPSECVVAPRTPAQITTACEVAGKKSTPTPASDWTTIAAGLSDNDVRIPVDEIPTFQKVLDQIIACQNAGDLGREIALMSDLMAGRRLRGIGLCDSAPDLAAVAKPDWRWRGTQTIRDVYTAGDDRRNALVTVIEPGTRRERIQLASFVRTGDSWTLDRLQQVEPEPGEGSVTARFFDCKGKAARDAACVPGALPIGVLLQTPDQSYVYPFANATITAPGELRWSDLEKGEYQLVLGLDRSVPIAEDGGTVIKEADSWAFSVKISNGEPLALIDIFTNLPVNNATPQPVSFVSTCGEGACGPCQVCDEWNGICAEACNAGEECIEQKTSGKPSTYICTCKDHKDSLCYADRSICRADPDDKCEVDEDCCFTPCIDGTCACLLDGEYCEQDIDCCDPRSCIDNSCQVAACSTQVGEACETDDECCDSACVDAVCRCCFTCMTADGLFSTAAAGLCCPLGSVCYPETEQGIGFARCCTPGIDCLGDPSGPPAWDGANYTFGNTCW